MFARIKMPGWTGKSLRAGIFMLANLMLLTALPASGAGSVTLAWIPSISPNVAGYYVYFGGASGVYTNRSYAGSTTNAIVSNLVAGRTYYFAVTSYDTAGDESSFSNEATYSVPVAASTSPVATTSPVRQNPRQPLPAHPPVRTTASGPPLVLGRPALSGRRFSFAVSGVAGSKYAVETSVNLVTWVRTVTNRAPFTFTETNVSQFGKRFFRAVRIP